MMKSDWPCRHVQLLSPAQPPPPTPLRRPSRPNPVLPIVAGHEPHRARKTAPARRRWTHCIKRPGIMLGVATAREGGEVEISQSSNLVPLAGKVAIAGIAGVLIAVIGTALVGTLVGWYPESAFLGKGRPVSDNGGRRMRRVHPGNCCRQERSRVQDATWRESRVRQRHVVSLSGR